MSATATTEKKYLKWYQKLAYGSGDLASNCSYGLVSSFVLLYLTGTLGLDSAIIGSLMLASKVLDGISDVIFGTLIDRTHSKLGKARPWMLFGQVGVSLCLFLLFAIPAGSTTMQYIYFFIVYTALNAVFYTANGIAYSSLVALITKNNNERVQLGSFRFMFAVVTNIFMGFAVTGMVEKFGSGAAGWRTTALIFAIVGLVVNTISCLAVKELPEEELSGNTSEAAEEGKAVAEEKKHGFAETAKILVHNKYYLMILAIYIVYYIFKNPDKHTLKEAQDWSNRIYYISQAIYGGGQPSGEAHARLKEALKQRGIFTSALMRKPVLPLNQEEKDWVAQGLERSQLPAVDMEQYK